MNFLWIKWLRVDWSAPLARHEGRDTLCFYLSLLVSTAVGVLGNLHGLVDPYLKTDDARPNLFWLHQLNDPALFQNDLLTDFARFYGATGTRWLYEWSSALIDPFQLAAVMPMLMSSVCGLLLYLIGRQLHGPLTGLLCVLTFMLFPNHMLWLNCGYSRVFAFPLALLFLYGLLARRFVLLLLALPLSALFYPSVFLLNALCYALWTGWQWLAHAPDRHRLLLWMLAAMALAALAVVPKYAFSHADFGHLLHPAEAYANPSLHAAGRTPLLPAVPLWRQLWPVLDSPMVGLMGLALLLLHRGRLLRLIPLPLCLYMVSGFVLYELAYQVLLQLYFPYKFTRYSFDMSLFLMLALGTGGWLDRLPKAVCSWTIVGLIMLLGWASYGDSLKADRGRWNYSKPKPLYEFLRTTPKDSLLAAPPYLADNLPLFALRKVLFNHELATPWFSRYADRIEQRIIAFYTAYYARDPHRMVTFAQHYGVNYMLLDKRDMQRLGRKRFYIEPYNGRIAALARQSDDPPWLAEHWREVAVFSWDSVVVLDMAALASRYPTAAGR